MRPWNRIRFPLGAASALLAGLAASHPAGARAPDYEVTESAETYPQPKGIVLSPDGGLAYVTHFGIRNRNNVGIHRTDTLERIGTLQFEGNAVEAVITRDGRTLYVSNFRRAVVEVIDLESRAVAAEIPVGRNPKTMAISRDERTLYVSNWSSDDVSVVDLVRGEETHRLRVGRHPRGIAVTAGGTLIVGNHADHTLAFFAAPTYERIRDDIECGLYPRHVILSPDDRYAYVSVQATSAVFRIDVGTGEILDRWWGGRNLKTIAVTADGRYIFTAVFLGEEVIGIDTEDGTTREYRVRGIEKPCGLAVSPDGAFVLVTGWDNQRLYALRRRDPEAAASP
jgi:YVTN family beta-propeller protein